MKDRSRGEAMRKWIIALILCGMTLNGCKGGKSYQSFIIATATPGGTYYPVGVAIGALITIKLHKTHRIAATAITSAGSAENIQMLINQEVEFAILQALFGAMAYQGEDRYKGKAVRDLRAITVLWENVEHFVLLKKYSRTGSITDLRDLNDKFSIGKRGSGTEISGLIILGALGIGIGRDIKPEYLGYNSSALAIIDGRVAGANMPAGIPASAVTQLYAQLGGTRVTLLQINKPQLEKVAADYPIWREYTIKAGTYPGQKNDIHTIAQPNFLACRANLSEEVAYLVAKTIYENLTYLTNIHKATSVMKLENAVRALPVPLHPGAARYYLEKGLKIPQQLLTHSPKTIQK